MGGDLYTAGGNVALGRSIARDASLAGGRITVDGRIAGRLRAAEAIRAPPWRSLGLGFAVLVAVPLLALLLVLTLPGIPPGIAVIALYPALLLIGFVAGLLFVARRLHQTVRGGPEASPASTIGFAALALLLLLMLLGALPFIGALLLAGATVVGRGACVLALARRTRAAPA